MTITYDDVQLYCEANEAIFQSQLDLLEGIITKARDKNRLPVYLTKQRVKNPDSVYLKTKRKARKLEEIRDYAGLRILCLFEQHILPVHDYLIERFTTDGYTLVDVELYNWADENAAFHLRNSLAGILTNEMIKEVARPSGYKSIHYGVEIAHGKKNCPIEIQLRTLLQDVWGELEHALCYKQGSIHPHIRKSFQLLAKDLETNDALMRHLKGLSDNERASESYENVHSVSPYYFDPERPIKVFTTGRLKYEYEEYKAFIQKSMKAPRTSRKWVDKASQLYVKIVSSLKSNEKKLPDIRYWIEGEDAFLIFSKGDLNDALIRYESITTAEYGKHYYVPHFRKGEVYFAQGEPVKALAAFDKCDALLNPTINPRNAYRVKAKLAYVYWHLGQEYFSQAIAQMEEAKGLINTYKDRFDELTYSQMLNNLCWYKLDKYLASVENKDSIEKQDEHYENAKEIFDELEASLTKNKIDANNPYDTAAWFLYQTYLRTRDRDYLESARKYCEEARTRMNLNTSRVASGNIQRNHYVEIMGAK